MAGFGGIQVNNNQSQNFMAAAPTNAAAGVNINPQGDNSVNANGNNDLMAGMNNMNMAGMLGNANMNMAGLNPNDLNSAMNAVLMNNALQQQATGGMGAGGMMNPLVLQTMMGQGMLSNPFGGNPAPSMGMNGMGGMNNLLAQQNMMMNPAAAMGMMGGNLNAMGGMGMPPGLDLGGAGGNPMNNNGNAASAPGTGNENAPAPAINKSPNGTDNSNDLFAQLMQNPMATQMMAQGLNPMMLLGGMGGGMGQNQFGGVGAAGANPLGALALGMNGLGGGLGNSASGSVDASAAMPASLSSGGAGGSSGAAKPHPNALFAYSNNHPAVSQSGVLASALKLEDGIIKQPLVSAVSAAANARAIKKHNKKTKVKGKPKRPLSAYNFFFREERSRILDSLPKGHKKRKKKKGSKGDDGKDDKDTDAIKKEEGDNDAQNDDENKDYGKNEGTAKYGGKDYDQVGEDGKKIPHGKIGFENLAKLIGKRWQELDADGIEKYKQLADQDMTRYKKEMEVFLTKEAQAGVDGELPSGALAGTAGFYSMMNPQKRKPGVKTEGESMKKKIKKEATVEL